MRFWLFARSSSGPVAVKSGGGLVIVAVKGAKDPVQARDFDGNSKARIHIVLDDVRRKVRLAEAGDQSQPRSDLKFVIDKYFLKSSGYGGRRGAKVLASRAGNRKDVIKVFALMLGESVHSDLDVISPEVGVEGRLQASIVGGLVHIRDHGHIVRRRRCSWPDCSDRRVKQSAAGLD